VKIKIDTDNKTISVEKDINLGRFIEALDKLFPNQQWKEFTLETGIEIKWSNPIVIEKIIPYHEPYYPWWTGPIITYGTEHTTNPYTVHYNSGIYCVDVKDPMYVE